VNMPDGDASEAVSRTNPSQASCSASPYPCGQVAGQRTVTFSTQPQHAKSTPRSPFRPLHEPALTVDRTASPGLHQRSKSGSCQRLLAHHPLPHLPENGNKVDTFKGVVLHQRVCEDPDCIAVSTDKVTGAAVGVFEPCTDTLG
jgi:hypothetical protein